MRDLSKILNTSICCILIGLLIWQKAAAQTLTPRSITTTAASNGFYEYLPLGYDPAGTQKYPLIVFCHGQGEIGNGTTQLAAILDNGLAQQLDNQVNHNNTQHFPTSFAVNGNSFSFIVILPQFNTWPASTDIDNIINYAIANYNVDVGRMYLTGLSMGGGVVWAYAGGASTYANRLAAILPVSGAATLGQGSAQIIASANLPVFATHNSQDPTVPPTYTIDNVNFINSSNPPPNPLAVDSIFPVASPQHDAWTKTYDPTQKLINGLNVYQWMLQYSRLSLPLPLTMLAYTATALPGAPEVRVDWTTAFEQNIKYFILQRSPDGQQFSNIDTVTPPNLSGNGHSYTYTDDSPFPNIDFYRLTEVDLDGKIGYYGILEVSPGSQPDGLRISPNPSTGTVYLELVHPDIGTLQISLLDVQGRTIKNWTYEKQSLSWNQSLNLAGVASGTYFIRIQGPTFREVRQVIKK
jgi:poly(3-hydroxybutyrate) depolymerase